MINKKIIKTIVSHDLKWKVQKLPSLILMSLLGYALIYFLLGEDKDVGEIGTYYTMAVCACLSLGTLLPGINSKSSSKNFSWNYLLTITRDIKSFLVGNYIAGFIFKIPLMICLVYILSKVESKAGTADYWIIIPTVIGLAFVFDSFVITSSISSFKQVAISQSIQSFKDKALIFLVKMFGLTNLYNHRDNLPFSWLYSRSKCFFCKISSFHYTNSIHYLFL